jgi:hypothetical protein
MHARMSVCKAHEGGQTCSEAPLHAYLVLYACVDVCMYVCMILLDGDVGCRSTLYCMYACVDVCMYV